MALTRIGQITGELQDILELTYVEGVLPSVTAVKAHTGAYSWGNVTLTDTFGFVVPSTTQVEANYFLNHNGITSNLDPRIFSWTGTFGIDYIYWDGTDDLLKLNINGVDRATVSAAIAGIDAVDTWYSVGISLKTDAAAGWVSLYIDGIEVLTWTGDTGAYVDTMGTSGRIGIFGAWSPTAYIDDFYCDDAVGEPQQLPVAKRFLYTSVDGSGNNDWTNSSGDSINNYTYVDDVPSDGDATYVSATSALLKDDYDVSSVAFPVGWDIIAAIPTTIARVSAPGPTVKIYSYDGLTFQTSAAKPLTTGYAIQFERQELQPDGSAWNLADFNATQFGIESDGIY